MSSGATVKYDNRRRCHILDENKTNPDESAKEQNTAETVPETPLHLFDNEDMTDITVVRNSDTQQKKKKEKKKKTDGSVNRQRQKRLSFMLGLVILIFACLGVALTAWNSIRYIKSTADTTGKFAKYNAFLTPIAAVDPDAFDDIAAANEEQLLNCAIWAILNNDATPDTYAYSNGYMMIPSTDVESAYGALFGSESVKSLAHQTVNSYNCVFEFNSSALMYQIPVTAISPVYTPRVTEVDESGSSLIITVEYLAAESWNQDKEGNFIAPEPDKVMSITLREAEGAYYISAVKTLSATIPDIVPLRPDVSVTEPPSNEPSSNETSTSETTTEKQPERATLGGRI